MQPRLVIHMVIDDLGREQFSKYATAGTSPGYPATPFFDELWDHGCRFTSYYAEPFCSPCRGTHMSGRSTEDTGLGDIIESDADLPLMLSEFILPELLRAKHGNDIALAAIGKWHLGTTAVGGPLAPNVAGFDYFFGTERNITDYYNATLWLQGQTLSSLGRYVPEIFANAAIAWLRRFAGDPLRRKGYLYLPWHLPHVPFHRPPTYLYNTGTWDCPLQSPSSQTTSEIIPYFKAMIEALDTLSKRVWDSIPTRLKAETVLIVSSDNGTDPAAYAFETWPDGTPCDASHAKRSNFDPGIRVPAYVYGAGINGNRTISGCVQARDFYKTTACLFGGDDGFVAEEGDLTYEQQIDQIIAANKAPGVSPTDRSYNLADILYNGIGSTTPRSHAITGIFSPNGYNRGLTSGRRAITDGRWKLTFSGTAFGTSPTFYDVQSDPKELSPITSPDATQLAAKNALLAKWAEFYASLPPV